MPDLSDPEFPSVTELGGWLPQFEVQQQAQAGEDGALYLGRQAGLGRGVVIEVMPEPDAAVANGLLERLRCRARLVHPGITAVYDFGRLPNGQFYLVEEAVDGVLLETMIAEGQLKPKTAFPLALQICEALQMVHDLPMPHGALSPQTVGVTADGQVKLTGIGMVQRETGELSWLRPFRGSFTSDMEALGLTLHWMFARCAPDAEGRLSRDLPPAFAVVFRRCLEPDSGRMFTRPEDVATALKEALKGTQESAEATTRTRMVVGPGGRQPTGPAPVHAPPPKVVPGQLRPVARQTQRSFLQQMDAFVWRAFSTGLHLMISLVCIGCVILVVFFKDRIVIEKEEAAEPVPAVEEMDAEENNVEEMPSPQAVLGGLAPAHAMAAEPVPVAETKPSPEPQPVPPPVDPMADLRAQYVEAVQEAANQALESVKLDDLPYLQQELQLLQSGGDIPAVDEPNLPNSLRVLRERYREVRDRMVTAAP